MKSLAVFTSGGDAPGMNACIRAVVRTALHHGLQVFGIVRGYQGLIEDDIIPLDAHSVSGIIQQGGTILRTARSQDFRTPEGRKKAHENLRKRNIDYVVAIGGDGTFTGADVFMAEYPEVKFVGIPGTIDNDLYGTDYTIGFDTAINTAMNAIDAIKDTANAHDRLFFIEVMGRDAGFIALRCAIATGAEAVLVPEVHTDMTELIDQLKRGFEHKKNSSIVIVAEGDDFGGAMEVADAVKPHLPGIDIRVSILGHIQRGGRPTCQERVLASRLGMEAVKALLEGKKGVMIGEISHQITYTPFSKAIKHHQTLSPTLLEMVEILA